MDARRSDPVEGSLRDGSVTHLGADACRSTNGVRAGARAEEELNVSPMKMAMCAAALTLLGCAGETEDGSETTSQPLIGGTWVPPPANGVVTGSGGRVGNLVVCRAWFDNGQHPGKVWEGNCNIGWGKLERKMPSFEVLLDGGFSWINPGHWVNTPFGPRWVTNMPSNAVDGGDGGDTVNHVRMGVCQAWMGDGWHPGKYLHDNCNVGWGGKEHILRAVENGTVLLLVQ
jgi:hypothetical protein